MRKPGFGPDTARLVLVGEAFGSEEEKMGRPFVGGAGNELKSWLRLANIPANDIFMTNVLNKRPFGNDFKQFCLKKKDAQESYHRWKPMLEMEYPDDWPQGYIWPPIESSRYLHPQYLGDATVGLYDEIKARQPNLVVALGNKACWALLGKTGIKKIRGTIVYSPYIDCKVLPILHPANILRDYESRPLSVVDMMKAAEEMKFAEIVRPDREIWLDPDISDLHAFKEKLSRSRHIGCDIETEPGAGFIKMVGFSADYSAAIAVPFYDPRREDGNYWPTADHEREAWGFVESWLHLPQTKIFQNGQYDMSWLWALHGLHPNDWDDTLLQAHALQPELPKDLGTLGSIWTNEPAWKEEYAQRSNKDEA